jgi:hypothetical protein
VKSTLVLLAALALAGCQTMRDHPKATAFIATSLALSAGIAVSNRGRDAARSQDIHLNDPPCRVQPNGSCR